MSYGNQSYGGPCGISLGRKVAYAPLRCPDGFPTTPVFDYEHSIAAYDNIKLRHIESLHRLGGASAGIVLACATRTTTPQGRMFALDADDGGNPPDGDPTTNWEFNDDVPGINFTHPYSAVMDPVRNQIITNARRDGNPGSAVQVRRIDPANGNQLAYAGYNSQPFRASYGGGVVAVTSTRIVGCGDDGGNTRDLGAWTPLFADAAAPLWALNAAFAVSRCWGSPSSPTIIYNDHTSGGVHACDEDGEDGQGGGVGSTLWDWTPPAGVTAGNKLGVGGALSNDGSVFYLGCRGSTTHDSGRLVAIDVATGAQLWISSPFEDLVDGFDGAPAGAGLDEIAAVRVDDFGHIYVLCFDIDAGGANSILCLFRFRPDGSVVYNTIDEGITLNGLVASPTGTPERSGVMMDIDELGRIYLARGSETNENAGNSSFVRLSQV